MTLRNYKSIAACKVDLSPLTFLVGRNGAGKSNFCDALRLVSDALRNSLDYALRERISVREVRRRSRGHPHHFSIRLDFILPDGRLGHYALKIGATAQAGGFRVQTEECMVGGEGDLAGHHHYLVKEGVVTRYSEPPPPPASSSDKLFLVAVSGVPGFRPVFDALSRMASYSLNPAQLRDLQNPDAGTLLRRDGANAPSVFAQLLPDARDRVQQYLSKVVPGLTGVHVKTLGPKETLEFDQQVKGDENPWSFYAASMSDGTLRAFGILVALFQSIGRPSQEAIPLVVLEEPEAALHPGAAGILLGSLMDASSQTQVIVTSHSGDLLDDEKVEADAILAVSSELGLTKIAPLDAASRQMLKDHLYTAGELLRLDQIEPREDAISDVDDERQLRLFDLDR